MCAREREREIQKHLSLLQYYGEDDGYFWIGTSPFAFLQQVQVVYSCSYSTLL